MQARRRPIPHLQARAVITVFIAAMLAVSLLPGMASAAPGQSIQQMVDSASPGSTVSVPSGIYHEIVYVTKPLTLKAQPGAIIDGGDRPFWIVAAAHDVTIDGFEMRGGKNWEHWGGITNSHNNVHYDRLTVQNSTLHGASYAAIATKLGAGHRILNNTTYNNGSLGIRIDSGSGHLIAGNRMYDNNLAGRYDSGWEAGGIKVSGNYDGVHNVTIENNHAYNNNGAGIWVDIDGNNVTIRHNNVHHNTRSGITYELSFGGNIHDNSVWENGHGYAVWGWGAGILIQNSSDVSVSNNTVAWNASGISVISQDRGNQRWNRVRNAHVFDNTIALVHPGGWDTYALAWLQDWNGPLLSSSADNRGWGNSYWVNTADGADPRFRWGEDTFFNLGDFMNTPGEANGRYLDGGDMERTLDAMAIDRPDGQPAPVNVVNNSPPSTEAEPGTPLAAGTAHDLAGAFSRFWEQNGGLPVFGYALSDEFQQFNPDSGQVRTVQYMERQRFEYHPELAGTPYEVLIGRLGVASAERRGLAGSEPFQPRASNPGGPGCLFFVETGHSLCDLFQNYWRGQGQDMGDPGVSMRESVALFGYPISEVFTDPDTGLTTQYFERAIFEHHPGNSGSPYEVLLVRLGEEEIKHTEW